MPAKKLPLVAIADAPIPFDSTAHLIGSKSFVDGFEFLAKQAFDNAADKGFWDDGDSRNQGEMIALMHSELSEGLEALRKDPNKPDEKVPEFTNLSCELADTIVRIMDFSHAYGLNVGAALVAKMRFNAGRPRMHGNKAF